MRAPRDRALTRNAADRTATKYADQVERDRAERFRLALRATLKTSEGRELLWCLLRGCGLYDSVFHRDAGVMAFNAGRQNWGQQLLADMLDVAPKLYVVMEREARDRESREAAAIDAAQTPSAETQESTNA